MGINEALKNLKTQSFFFLVSFALKTFICLRREVEFKMPTCMHIAYHNEAKRRQRVLDKKREALQRLVIQQVRNRVRFYIIQSADQTSDNRVSWTAGACSVIRTAIGLHIASISMNLSPSRKDGVDSDSRKRCST